MNLQGIFGPLESLFLINLVVAFVCGLIIGGEREFRHKPAGISTQTLVISGSMIFSFLSQNLGAGDPSRIAAQIVSGIGFLGAGIILRSSKDDSISNVTTAASIWFSASVGMAIGFNFTTIAILAALYAALVSSVPKLSVLLRLSKRR